MSTRAYASGAKRFSFVLLLGSEESSSLIDMCVRVYSGQLKADNCECESVKRATQSATEEFRQPCLCTVPHIPRHFQCRLGPPQTHIPFMSPLQVHNRKHTCICNIAYELSMHLCAGLAALASECSSRYKCSLHIVLHLLVAACADRLDWTFGRHRSPSRQLFRFLRLRRQNLRRQSGCTTMPVREGTLSDVRHLDSEDNKRSSFVDLTAMECWRA